eukprot:8423047-Alexandrium_andersonii.AAC.1
MCRVREEGDVGLDKPLEIGVTDTGAVHDFTHLVTGSLDRVRSHLLSDGLPRGVGCLPFDEGG